MLELMAHLMRIFEQVRGSHHISYKYVAERWPGSRAMLDILLEQAKSAGLVIAITPAFIEITLKGKMYAVENKLVE